MTSEMKASYDAGQYAGYSEFVPRLTTRLAAASDEVYQLLAQGRWFYPSTPASSTTKTGRHDIAEILLNVASHPGPFKELR
jgi:hypothetical protein